MREDSGTIKKYTEKKSEFKTGKDLFTMKLPFKGLQRRGSYEIDMTNGPLLGKIVRFAIPLALAGILQLLFNAADIVVAGRFAGSQALAAVGSTGALNMLIINLFMGLSVGVNVLVARYYGSGSHKDLGETVHTAMLTALVCGVALVFIGMGLSRPLLALMGTPADVIDQSVLYMRIVFAGMPALMLYNFGAAILRAVGDTQRPLYFLMCAGVLNVLLNLFCVIVLRMGVAGVATATAVSQCLSAALVVLCLLRSDAVYRLDLHRLHISKDKLLQMTKIGVPAGIQGAMFSLSNVVIQSNINSFGSIAMAGSTAAGNLEGFVFTAEDAFAQAALSFTGQNYGARKFDRINKVLVNCVLLVSSVGIVLGCTAYLLSRPLLGIYSTDPEVISFGTQRMLLVCLPHFICGIMGIFTGCLRGLGSSVAPMLITVFGTCVLRVAWVYTVFPLAPTWQMLFLSYPISWLVTGVIQFIAFLSLKKRANSAARPT